MRKWAPQVAQGCGSLPATVANLDRVLTLFRAPTAEVWSWVWAPRCGAGPSPGCLQCCRVSQVRWRAELCDDSGGTAYWVQWARDQLTAGPVG